MKNFRHSCECHFNLYKKFYFSAACSLFPLWINIKLGAFINAGYLSLLDWFFGYDATVALLVVATVMPKPYIRQLMLGRFLAVASLIIQVLLISFIDRDVYSSNAVLVIFIVSMGMYIFYFFAYYFDDGKGLMFKDLKRKEQYCLVIMMVSLYLTKHLHIAVFTYQASNMIEILKTSKFLANIWLAEFLSIAIAVILLIVFLFIYSHIKEGEIKLGGNNRDSAQ